MEYITLCIQIVISLVFPIWIYLWFDMQIRKLLYKLGLDIQFFVKRWWALRCICKKQKTKESKYADDVMSKLNKLLQPQPDNPKIRINEDVDKACDSMFFYGADQKGNSLFIKIEHRGRRTTELILQVSLSDGRIYVLPDDPHTMITTDGTNRKWSTSDFKIELSEHEQRLRIIFNGLLRNQCSGNVSNNDNVEHIRLNFIFIGNSCLLRWPNDWSAHLHADALAREPWESHDWINKIKSIDHRGFDQWGSMIGQVKFKDSTESTLYLRGFRQRRWGEHESYQFHQTVTFLGVIPTGAMYYLGLSKTKNSFSQ